MADTLLQSIVAAAGKANSDIDQGKTDTAALISDTSSRYSKLQSDEQNGAIISGGQVITPLSVQTNELSELLRQNATIGVARGMGVDPTNAADVLHVLGAQQVDQAKTAINAAQSLANKTAVKFTEHPVDYVINQFTHDADVQEAEAAKNAENTTRDAIAGIRQSVENTSAVYNFTRQSITQESIASQVQGIKNNLDAEVQKTGIVGNEARMRGIAELQQMDSRQIQDLATAQSAKIQAGDYALHQAQFAEQTRMNDLHIKIMQSEYDDKVRAREGVEADVAAAQIGVKDATGRDGVYSPKVIEQLLIKKDPYMTMMVNNGLSHQALGIPVVGENSAQIAALKIIAPQVVLDKTEGGQINDAYNNAIHEASLKGTVIGPDGKAFMYDNKKPAEVAKAAGLIVDAKMKAWHANVNPNDASNPYSAMPLQTYFAPAGVTAKDGKVIAPSLADTAFGKYIAPTIAAGQVTTLQPEVIMSQAVDAILANKKDPTQGGDFNTIVDNIAHLGSTVQVANNALKQFSGKGITPQSAYNVAGSTPYGFNTVYNMADKNDVSRQIMQMLRTRVTGMTSPAISIAPGQGAQ